MQADENIGHAADQARAQPTINVAALWFRREQIEEQIKALEAERLLLAVQITAQLSGGSAA